MPGKPVSVDPAVDSGSVLMFARIVALVMLTARWGVVFVCTENDGGHAPAHSNQVY